MSTPHAPSGNAGAQPPSRSPNQGLSPQDLEVKERIRRRREATMEAQARRGEERRKMFEAGTSKPPPPSDAKNGQKRSRSNSQNSATPPPPAAARTSPKPKVEPQSSSPNVGAVAEEELTDEMLMAIVMSCSENGMDIPPEIAAKLASSQGRGQARRAPPVAVAAPRRPDYRHLLDADDAPPDGHVSSDDDVEIIDEGFRPPPARALAPPTPPPPPPPQGDQWASSHPSTADDTEEIIDNSDDFREAQRRMLEQYRRRREAGNQQQPSGSHSSRSRLATVDARLARQLQRAYQQEEMERHMMMALFHGARGGVGGYDDDDEAMYYPHREPVRGRRHRREQEQDMSYEALVELEDVPTPLPGYLLNKIPRRTHKVSEMTTEELANPTQCPVCLMPFEEGEEVATLPDCLHEYHWECIQEWFKQRKICCVCKVEVGSQVAL